MYEAIHEKVIAFKKTGQGKEEAFNLIRLFAYNYPVTHWGWDEEKRSEFYIFFEDDLDRIINQFTDRGIDFIHYLNTCLYWQKKTFMKRHFLNKKKHCLYDEHLDATNIFTEESCRTYRKNINIDNLNFLPITNRVKYREKIIKKRLLILSMKSVLNIPEDYLIAVALYVGCSINWIFRCRDILYGNLQKRRERFSLYRKRRNTAYLSLIKNEISLKEANSTEERLFYIRQIKRSRHSLIINQKTLSSLPSSPTNQEIGKLLGIPKGSIDSSLNQLKIRNPALYQKTIFDYSYSYEDTISNGKFS